MTRLTFLDRFRPVGAPGAGAPEGAPSTDVVGPEVELAPVFACLEIDVKSSRALEEDAQSEADKELANAREQAEAIVAQARMDIGAEQAKAAARIMQAATEGDTKLLEQATKVAAQIHDTGISQLPTTTTKVIETLFSTEMIKS